MADTAKLQVHQLTELASGSLSCTVRCLSGVARVGDPVRLTARDAGGPLAGELTISAIEFGGGIAMDFVDQGRTALVTVTGAIDDAAVRAAVSGTAPDELFRLGLLLVASTR